MISKLESLLTEIGGFNSAATDLQDDADGMRDKRATIIESAKTFGLSHRTIDAMLAKIKCSVTLPKTDEPTAVYPGVEDKTEGVEQNTQERSGTIREIHSADSSVERSEIEATGAFGPAGAGFWRG